MMLSLIQNSGFYKFLPSSPFLELIENWNFRNGKKKIKNKTKPVKTMILLLIVCTEDLSFLFCEKLNDKYVL